MNNKQIDGLITALYERLSRDDEQLGDSNSIVNQKKMLETYCEQNGYTNIVHYTDDGYSGGSFDRPDWKRLIEDIEAGKVGMVITKDMSRIGRNYLEVGYYTEIYFGQKNIRFIAIANGVDSENQGSSEFAPFLNVMNEWYLRDCSRKIRATKQVIGNSGKHISSHAPYGYKKDPEDKHHWLVDEEAAEVVRRIYRLCIEGKGIQMIAKQLQADKIEMQYFIEKECAAKGMCAHVCYHDTDGHNPHAHIMLTVRPLNKNGSWQHKTEKEYLCVRNGEERGFTAAEFIQAEREGCELEERIDHRSHKDRGLLEQPTIYEGVIAIAMERKGYISDRCEINRQIRKDNSFLCNIMEAIKYLIKSIFAIVDRLADEMEEVRVNMLTLEYDRFKGYPDETAIQKQMQTYRTLQAKAADLDQEKLNEKRMSIRPKKEEEAQKRISDLYGYCQDNLFRASKNAVAKRLGEQPANIEKQEPNKQTVPTPSWLKGRKKKDDRDER